MISANATLQDVIQEIARLQRQIDAMELAKQAGRNVTGARAVPSSSTDLISGDIAGDYLYDGNDRLRLDVIDNSGTLEWRVITESGV
jgi:hypothetical protein